MMPSPVYWFTVPSKRCTPSVSSWKKRSMIRCHSSGSSCSASSIEPFTSAKSTVTCLRSPSSAWRARRIFSARCLGVYARGSGCPEETSASRRPHSPQNLTPGAFSKPQLEQRSEEPLMAPTSRDASPARRPRNVHQVVVAAEPLPAKPRRRHLPLLGSGQVLRLDGLEEGEALLNALAELGEGLLGVRVGRRLPAGEVRGRVLRLVAGGLHLADEGVLIRRQAGLGEHLDVEGFGLRVCGGLVHPMLEVLHARPHLEVEELGAVDGREGHQAPSAVSASPSDHTAAPSSTTSFSRNCPGTTESAGKPPRLASQPGVEKRKLSVVRNIITAIALPTAAIRGDTGRSAIIAATAISTVPRSVSGTLKSSESVRTRRP